MSQTYLKKSCVNQAAHCSKPGYMARLSPVSQIANLDYAGPLKNLSLFTNTMFSVCTESVTKKVFNFFFFSSSNHTAEYDYIGK